MSGEKPDGLRRRAEEWVKSGASAPTPSSDQLDSLRLFHELQVHQIELQMQYEELLLAKEELEGSNKRYRDLYEFAPVGFFTLRADGAILSVNRRGADILGVEISKLAERSFISFVDLPERERFRPFLDEVLTGKVALNFETVLCLDDGRRLPVRLEAVASEDGSGCRVAVSDISQVREAEKEHQKLEE